MSFLSKGLLAIALLVLGFMLLGVQRNMLSFSDRFGTSLARIEEQLKVSNTKLDGLVKRQRGVARVGKPIVKAVKHVLPKPQPGPFDWFKNQPPQG